MLLGGGTSFLVVDIVLLRRRLRGPEVDRPLVKVKHEHKKAGKKNDTTKQQRSNRDGSKYLPDRGSLPRASWEAVDLLRLEVAHNSRPNPGGNFLFRGRLVGHPACLDISRQSTKAHLIHPQWSRHQREYPSMVDHRENERGGQTFLAQRLPGVEEGAEPGLKGLDDTIILVIRAL